MSSKKKSLMRCLGEFTGHIFSAIRKPAGPETHELRHETQKARQGDVVLRRTVIEEVELPAEQVCGDEDTCS